MATEPVICFKCVDSLEKAHIFRTTCLKVEDEIINYLCANSNVSHVDDSEPKINLRNLKKHLAINGKIIPDPHQAPNERKCKINFQDGDVKSTPSSSSCTPDKTVSCDISNCLYNLKKEPFEMFITAEGDIDRKDNICINVKPNIYNNLDTNDEAASSKNYRDENSAFLYNTNVSENEISIRKMNCDESAFEYRMNSHNISKQKVKVRPKKAQFSSVKCGGCCSRSRIPSDHSKVNNGVFTCFVCSITYNDVADIRKHVYKHALRYICNICSKRTRDQESLRVHLQSHTDVKPYQCHVCRKAFKQKFALSQHVRVHDPATSFRCDICNKIFSTKYNLNVHMNAHTKKEIFLCKYCNKYFVTNSQLKYHQQKMCTFLNL